MRLWAILTVLSLSAPLSGCGYLSFWALDALHPASVTSIEVAWGKDEHFCRSLIAGSDRSRFLIAGNTDQPRYQPVAAQAPEFDAVGIGARWRLKDRGLDLVNAPTVIKRGVAYAYVLRTPITPQESHLLPIPAVERPYAEGALRRAWHISFYRIGFDGRLTRQCRFIEQRWMNWAL